MGFDRHRRRHPARDRLDALNDAIQTARLAARDLPAGDAVAIAGDERAHPSDIVATRRNDRALRTSVGEPVRNRDVWDVVATHDSGALTVSHRGGHGTVTLPAEYVGQHVRLGYAATEHGNQGDTVDVGLQLVSWATTQRGLYVGATRGRHHNHLYVVAETDDLADAHDVLEAVLHSDRADRPAVTQRRELARDAHQQARTVQHELVPDWVRDERALLRERRNDLAATMEERAQLRNAATTRQKALQPELDAAQAAWQPYDEQIRALETDLRDGLRPALWKATAAHTSAGFGHRRSASRAAMTARAAVDGAEARLHAVHAAGSTARDQLDALHSEARHLNRLADPNGPTAIMDRVDTATTQSIDLLIGAIDTWANWAAGRRVSSIELDSTLDTLIDVARHGRPDGQRGLVPASAWLQLVDAVDPSLRTLARAARSHEPDRDVGLEL